MGIPVSVAFGPNALKITDLGEILTLQGPIKNFSPVFRPFLNETFGNQMNQNVTFSGTPEIIHNGGTSTEWTGSAVQGSWDFSTGTVVTLTNGVNNDQASFAEETPTTIDMNGFTALTGKINLTTYSDVNNSLIFEFDNAGVTVGNSIDLNDFIDTSLLAASQNFVIPKASLGLSTQLLDGLTIVLSRSGGPQVSFTLDDIQFEQTGDPAIFTVAPSSASEEFHVHELRLTMVDNVLTTALAWDKILGVNKLSVGITFRRVKDGATDFSATFQQMADMFGGGATQVHEPFSDGTDTMLTLEIVFPEPVILTGSPADNFLSWTVNDNLSGLLLFTAAARGAVVV